MIYLCPLQAGITHDQRVSFWAHLSGFITVVVQSLLPLYHIGNAYISLGPLQIGVTHDPTRQSL